MKLSSKALACGQSPMRKFHPYAVAAAAAGKKIYHLNIGQPDIHTPDALYDAIHNFRTPVLAYAASPGIPELIEAIERDPWFLTARRVIIPASINALHFYQGLGYTFAPGGDTLDEEQLYCLEKFPQPRT